MPKIRFCQAFPEKSGPNTQVSLLWKLSFKMQGLFINFWGFFEESKKFGTREWPNLNAKVANSLKMVGSAPALYFEVPVWELGRLRWYFAIMVWPRTTGRNSEYVTFWISAMTICLAFWKSSSSVKLESWVLNSVVSRLCSRRNREWMAERPGCSWALISPATRSSPHLSWSTKPAWLLEDVREGEVGWLSWGGF